MVQLVQSWQLYGAVVWMMSKCLQPNAGKYYGAVVQLVQSWQLYEAVVWMMSKCLQLNAGNTEVLWCSLCSHGSSIG